MNISCKTIVFVPHVASLKQYRDIFCTSSETIFLTVDKHEEKNISKPDPNVCFLPRTFFLFKIKDFIVYLKLLKLVVADDYTVVSMVRLPRSTVSFLVRTASLCGGGGFYFYWAAQPSLDSLDAKRQKVFKSKFLYRMYCFLFNLLINQKFSTHPNVFGKYSASKILVKDWLMDELQEKALGLPIYPVCGKNKGGFFSEITESYVVVFYNPSVWLDNSWLKKIIAQIQGYGCSISIYFKFHPRCTRELADSVVAEIYEDLGASVFTVPQDFCIEDLHFQNDFFIGAVVFDSVSVLKEILHRRLNVFVLEPGEGFLHRDFFIEFCRQQKLLVRKNFSL